MNPGRWRLRFIIFALVTLTLISALFFAQRALLRSLDARLSADLGAAGAEAVTDEVAGAFTATGIAAVVIGGVLALIIGHVLVGQIGRMRADTIARSRGEPGPPIPRPAVAELQALAAAIELLASEQGARVQSLTRERDDLALLVNSVAEGMLQVGSNGRIVFANPAARRLLGLPRGVTGEPVTAVVRNAELRSYLERALGGEAVGSCELTLDDRRMLVDVSTIRRGGGEDPPLGTVIAFTDLTEIRRLEGVRRDFVANVSHEIRTPLTSIRGYVETLLTDDLPPDVSRQFLDVIQKNADRLHGIVDDLLDLSRLESGGWRPQLEALDPIPIARDVWAGAYGRDDRKAIQFRTEGEAAVVADPSALRHVFSNLFDNAVRYTPEGGRITVRVGAALGEPPRASDADTPPGLETDDLPRRYVTIEVTDTGSGIPHDALSRIFERFYRVDPARSRSEGGTGLGLSIVKHLVESMSGDVTASSALGKGTTLRIRLPAA